MKRKHGVNDEHLVPWAQGENLLGLLKDLADEQQCAIRGAYNVRKFPGSPQFRWDSSKLYLFIGGSDKRGPLTFIFHLKPGVPFVLDERAESFTYADIKITDCHKVTWRIRSARDSEQLKTLPPLPSATAEERRQFEACQPFEKLEAAWAAWDLAAGEVGETFRAYVAGVQKYAKVTEALEAASVELLRSRGEEPLHLEWARDAAAALSRAAPEQAAHVATVDGLKAAA